MFDINYLLTGSLCPCYEIRSPIFSFDPNLRGSCVKVRASYFLYGQSNSLGKSFINGIIIFQTKATCFQDLHIDWYVVLMFTNRLTDI